MDGDRFDTLTRNLSAATSRRRLVGLVTGVIAGIAHQVRDTSAQACKPPGATCRPQDTCCGGACTRGRCRCDPSQHLCGGACVDRCPRGAIRDADCGCVCPGGGKLCEGRCRPAAFFRRDVENCGACGAVCPAGPCQRAFCQNGVCGVEPDPGLAGQACDASDACLADAVCTADGSCVGTPIVCEPPFALDAECGCSCPPETPDYCDLGFGDRRCVNLSTDSSFCGDCHAVCFDNGPCVGGVCQPVCSLIDDSPCQAGQFCDVTLRCVPRLPYGQGCGRDAMCLSGLCLTAAGFCGCGAAGDCPLGMQCDGGACA